MKRTIKLLVGGLLVASLLSLSACNTVKGFGKDVEALGKTLQGSAE
ncbi:entericidin A/B family lipoprotein [Coraliomargarita parva]